MAQPRVSNRLSKTSMSVSRQETPDTTVYKRSKTVQTNYPRSDSSLNDGLRKKNNAVSHGLLMQYQAPVLIVKRPKCLDGPFSINDVPDLRELKKNFHVDYKRQVQNKQVNLTFYNDLELNNYFSKKSNWLNSSKFQNTSSFYSAVNVYLPLIKNKSLSSLTQQYTMEMKKNNKLT